MGFEVLLPQVNYGVWSSDAKELVKQLGKLLMEASGDLRARAFLTQNMFDHAAGGRCIGPWDNTDSPNGREKMDALIGISKDKWAEVQEHAKKSWPHGLPLYYFLKTQLDHPSMADQLNLQVFCPYGDISNGVIFMNTKGILYEVIIFPNVENTDKIIDALVETQRIDWNRRVVVPFAEVDALRCLNKAGKRIGLKIVKQISTIKHFLAKDTDPYDIECPPDTYFGPLKHHHIDQVDVAWPHRYATSKDVFKMLIDNDLTYGLYSAKDDSLLAWLTICEAGYLTHLYCEENHRRKGYAETVLKHGVNDQLKQGNDVFGYILDDNIGSMRLFRKLDFEVIGRGVWTYVTKETNM